ALLAGPGCRGGDVWASGGPAARSRPGLRLPPSAAGGSAPAVGSLRLAPGGASLPQHILMRIGIVGLGLMGGSLAMALRTLRPDWELVGHDTDQATLARALEQGLVSTGPVREVDLLVLAAPIPALPELLADLGGHPGVVTDVASTKARVMSWATAAGVDLVGGHPMCGRELSGLAAADTNLFRGA